MRHAATRRRRGEAGHLMAGLMALIAIMLILSTVAYQAWEDVVRRDNEAEMIFRAQEISRAIQRYRLDHGGAGPPSLDDLMQPGQRGQYYLRKRYADPLVEDGNWGLLFDGPNGQLIDVGGPVGEGRNLGFGEYEGAKENRAQGLPVNQGRFVRGGGQSIAGVKSLSADQPFRVYKGFSDYGQWLFSYHDYELQGNAQGRRLGVGSQVPNSPDAGLNPPNN